MNCASYAALLDGYLDGVLSPEEQALVENHLATCPECKLYVEDLRAIEAAFPTTEEIELPPNFTQTVMAEVAKHPRKAKKKFVNPLQHWALPAVACLAVVIYAGGHMSLPSFDSSSASTSTTTTTTSAAITYSTVPEMAESAVENRGMAEDTATSVVTEDTATGAIAEDLFGDEMVVYYSQSAVGTALDIYPATVLEDSNFAYQLTAEEFAAFLSQVDPDATPDPQDLYWVVVILQ